jgi:hypothetical protein
MTGPTGGQHLGTPGAVDRSFRSAVQFAAILLAASYLAFSYVYSHAAPLGHFENQIFGTPAWAEADPGGPYVDAAHQLAWGEGQLFEGHPGTVLILLLSGLQHIYYNVSGAGTGFSFTAFTARNLPTVFALSKVMMTVLHLIACFVVYRLATRLLRDDRSATFAAFAYATSLPVGYYLSRISVEPLMVIFFVTSLLSIWRFHDLAVEERLGQALGYAALSGLLAISGVVTKLNFLAPLVPFLALYILVGGWREAPERWLPWRTRLLALAAFASTLAVAGFIYSQFIDWKGFFSLWLLIAAQERANWELINFLPGFTAERIFPLSEFIFVLGGALGLATYLRAHPERRMPALWLSAFGAWGFLIFAFRIRSVASFLPFHYFYICNIVVAVFFGYALTLLLRRLPPYLRGGWRGAIVGLSTICAMHSIVIWAVINSRQQDAALYAPSRTAHDLISGLATDERLGCIRCSRPEKPAPFEFIPDLFPLTSVGWTTWENAEMKSALAAEFDSIFVPVQPMEIDRRARRIRLDALKVRVVVLDGPATQRVHEQRSKP